MKFLSVVIMAALMVCLNCLTAHADVQDLRPIAVLPLAAVSTSGDSSAIDLKSYADECLLSLDVSAPVSGTNPTLLFSLTESATSGGSYSAVSSSDFTYGGFSQVSSASSSQVVTFDRDKRKRFLKLHRVIGGTASPSYNASGSLFCEPRRK